MPMPTKPTMRFRMAKALYEVEPFTNAGNVIAWADVTAVHQARYFKSIDAVLAAMPEPIEVMEPLAARPPSINVYAPSVGRGVWRPSLRHDLGAFGDTWSPGNANA